MMHTQVSVPLTADQARRLVDAVMEHEGLAATATAYEDPSTGEWIFEATCTEPPDLGAFADLARTTLGGVVAFGVRAIDPAIDWVTRSLEGLPPVRAGRFYVHGSHETKPAPSGMTEILIDAAQAFGTGHHETTTGCLEAIDLTLKRRRPRTMLDVGTGTGVLAIALAKRTRKMVIASDIDPVAVRTAAENAAINGVGNRLVCIRADGLRSHAIVASAPYDLFVANILAGPLVRLAPAIGRVAARRGTIILSGLLSHQMARVVTAYAHRGMILRRRLVRRGWATLILEKRGK
jgi:ribosomal protein L11 methyltransferase